MSDIDGRALHYVFKIADRAAATDFFRQILGMKVLRHEEFAQGCDAACNGPYNTRWSKTMMGYGPEHTHFVLELTFNYPIRSYELGNDLLGVTIKSKEALDRARANNYPILHNNTLEAPGGYKFFILDEPQPTNADPIQKITLSSTNLDRTIEYWTSIVGVQLFARCTRCHTAILGFNKNQAGIEFRQIEGKVDHKTTNGRTAFSCPFDQQHIIEERATKANTKIVIPLTSLDTPGKATVRVIILGDPDDHEICMVDDEAFRELSEEQPEDEIILDRFIKKDATGDLKRADEDRQRRYDLHKKEEEERAKAEQNS